MRKKKVNHIRTLGVAEMDGKLKLIVSADGNSVPIGEFYGEDEAECFAVFMSNIFDLLNSKTENNETIVARCGPSSEFKS